jgi:uncharacterized protein YdaT
MPWYNGDYPPSMKNMDSRTRAKAVEIANALLADGHEEGKAIAIATSKAKEWILGHPGNSGNAADMNPNHSSNLHVVPFQNRWAVKEEGRVKPLHILDTKAQAVKKAEELASEQQASAIIHRGDGTVETSHNFS